MRSIKAGVIYFLLIFVLGWILGPIRELWAVPRLGRLTALLFEAVIMLIGMFLAARWVMRFFNVPQTLGSTIAMGLVALAILVPAEIAGVLWVRGLSLGEYLASFATAPGLISLVMFLLFAAMPTLVTLVRRGRARAVLWTSPIPRQRLPTMRPFSRAVQGFDRSVAETDDPLRRKRLPSSSSELQSAAKGSDTFEP